MDELHEPHILSKINGDGEENYILNISALLLIFVSKSKESRLASQSEDETESEDVTPPAIMMLNDDCLLYIFRFLPKLRMQVQAAHVCSRFLTLMGIKWRNCHRYDTLDLDTFHNILNEHEDIKCFIQELREHFNWCTINRSCLSTFLKDLKHINVHELPRIEGLNYDLDTDVDCLPEDDDIKELAKMMPNLRKLRFLQPITGAHVAKFSQLDELHLYDDMHKEFDLEQRYLDEICKKLKHLRVLDIRTYDTISELRLDNCIDNMKNITVLKLNLATLKSVLTSVLELPHLRKLSVRLDADCDVSDVTYIDTYDWKIYETEEFYHILTVKGAKIFSMVIDAYYMPLKVGWDKDISIHAHDKLEKLVICSWAHQPESLRRYLDMSKLQMVICRNWDHLKDDLAVEVIERCKLLCCFDVSYCKNLTDRMPKNALAILKKRPLKKPALKIHYLLSGFDRFTNAEQLFWGVHRKYLFLTVEPPRCGESGLSYFERGYEFEFEQNKSTN